MSEARHAIDLAVAADEVWAALVAGGARRWYYGLAAHGEFAAGSRLRWLDTDGDPMEESEVLAADAPRRLELRSRFLFAPHVAAAEPHRMSWTVTPAPGGSRVELAVEGGGPGAELIVREGDLVLRSLRLALDPEAQAALARRPEIGEVEIRDVTAERVADYQAFFDDDAFADYPAWQACYCMAPHRTTTDPEPPREENRRLMSGMLASGQATALLAYSGGKPVGWCQYGATTALAAIMERFQKEAGNLEGVGSIACFIVAAPYRGHGVARRLLDAALDRMREHGLREVEAYPVADPATAQVSFRGPRPLFEAAGFAAVREAGRTLVMRKALR